MVSVVTLLLCVIIVLPAHSQFRYMFRQFPSGQFTQMTIATQDSSLIVDLRDLVNYIGQVLCLGREKSMSLVQYRRISSKIAGMCKLSALYILKCLKKISLL